MKKICIIGLMILISLTNTAHAGDGISLSISCTIPAILGLNVPLIEEQTLKTQANIHMEQKTEPQKETLEQSPEMIQEDTQGEKLIGEEQNSLVLVKTLYSR